MHHLAVGRENNAAPVLVLIADLDVRVVHQTTGEVLTHITLDPTRGYQPRNQK